MKPNHRNHIITVITTVALGLGMLSACSLFSPFAPPATPVPAPFSDDLSRVKAAGKLVVGTSGDYAPFAFYSPQFQLDGLDIALMRELARRIGVQVVFQDFAADGVLDALRLKQVDAVAAALTVTGARQQVADFTRNYYIGADGIIARADTGIAQIRAVRGLAGRKIGVVRGSVYETWLRQTLINTRLLPANNLLRYGSVDEAVRDLRDRHIDVAVLDLFPAQQIATPGSPFRVVGQQLNIQRLSVAVRKSSTLLAALDQALASAQTDGTVNQLITRYLSLSASTAPPVLPTQPAPPAPPSPSVPGAVTTGPASPASTCIDGMAFIADLSYDDKNMTSPPVVNPGQAFVKGWHVRNSGTCPWTTAYRFDFAGGNTTLASMSGQAQQLGRTVNSGEVVDFQVSLVAPTSPGVYQGFWQMHNAEGSAFGSRVWVGINVPGNTLPNQPNQPAQLAGDVVFAADRTQINSGEHVVFTWQVGNAQSVGFYAEGDPNAQLSGVQFSGTAQVSPQATTTYSLRVTRASGVIEIRQITVQVAQASSAPVIARFSFSPDGQLGPGQCVTIGWDVQGQVNHIRILRNNAPWVDSAPATGSVQDCPATGQIIYTLEASGLTALTRAQHVLNVGGASNTGGGSTGTGAAPAVQNFSISDEQIPVGGCVTLSWATTNAVDVRLIRSGSIQIGQGQLSGSVVDCPPQPGFVGYRLEARNATGDVAVRERALTVYRPSSILAPTQKP